MTNATDTVTAAPVRQTTRRMNQRAVAPWLFLAPGLFMFAVYVLWPIAQSITLSFYDWKGLYNQDGEFTGTFVGMGNYAELMTDPAFETSLWNNLKWLVLYMAALPIGLFIAIFLNQTVRGIRLYKSLFFFPFVISQVVVGLMFAWFYAPNFGLFYLLTEWLTGKGIAILADPDLVTYGIIAAGLWPQIAYVMILYLTGLNNVAPTRSRRRGWTAQKVGRCCGMSSCRNCAPPPSSP